MIDIENKIFNDIATVLRNKYKGISVYGEYVETPKSFPCVTIVEEDNRVYAKTQDSHCGENHATLMYSVNVYSNLSSGKKSQAKDILKTIDDLMEEMKFTRSNVNQIPNTDRTIYRIVSRYTVVVQKGHDTEDGETVYQLYRK